MRKILICLAAAGAALAASTPALAQYYPPHPSYGYNQGSWGEGRLLHSRIDNIERRIDWLVSRDRISDRRADGLREAAHRLEQRLRFAGRDGLNPYEARDIRMGIDRLERQVRYSRSYGYGDRDRRDRD